MSQYKIYLASDLGATFSFEFFRDFPRNAVMGIVSKTQVKTMASDGIDAWEYVLDDAGGVVTSPAQVRVTATTSNGTGYYFGLWGNLNGLQSSGVESSFNVALTAANKAPVFVSVDAVNYTVGQTASVYTAVATDGDGDEPSYLFDNSPDNAFFSLAMESGIVEWVSPPDPLTPLDSDANNVYVLGINADDGKGGVAHISVNVTLLSAQPESDTTSVIDADAVAQMLGDELTLNGLSAVIAAVATAADASDVANKVELQNSIDGLQTQVAAALLAADRLESYEKGQIEVMLDQLVTSPNFLSLLSQANMQLDGKTVTVASVLEAIANAPKVANWKKTKDGNGAMNGVIATLTDGTAVTFAMSTTAIDAETNKHVFSVSNFAGTGLAKSFYMIMRSKVLSFGGLFGGRLTNQSAGWTLEEISNIVFDIVGIAPTTVSANGVGALSNA